MDEAICTAVEYDHDSGKFTWKIHSGVACKGDEAGTISKYGYRSITFRKMRYRAGRLAWFMHYGKLPSGVIDHINGNRDDNKIENLRDVSVVENDGNSIKHRNGHLVGTSYCRKLKMWKSTIEKDGKSHHLGYFKTPEEASAKYRASILGHE